MRWHGRAQRGRYYRFTKDPKQLEFAERAANYYLDNVGRTFVPLWDFDAPKNQSWPDTSAAAITASALVELSAFTGNTTCVFAQCYYLL
jgi:unsaturated chondroitin disaccharide hydrolase